MIICRKPSSKRKTRGSTAERKTARSCCKECWNPSPRFPNFTNHTILHSMDVLEYANALIGDLADKIQETLDYCRKVVSLRSDFCITQTDVQIIELEE